MGEGRSTGPPLLFAIARLAGRPSPLPEPGAAAAKAARRPVRGVRGRPPITPRGRAGWDERQPGHSIGSGDQRSGPSRGNDGRLRGSYAQAA